MAPAPTPTSAACRVRRPAPMPPQTAVVTLLHHAIMRPAARCALTGSFIGGYSVASISFGHLVHRYPPFKLMCVGLIIWVVAVVLSGLAPNFWVMVAARVLSGVGEASFQTVVPPYIDDNAPNNQRGLWLSAFYLAIPVGTAGASLDRVPAAACPHARTARRPSNPLSQRGTASDLGSTRSGAGVGRSF